MIFLLRYWKYLAAAFAIIAIVGTIHHSGYVAGKEKVQAAWNTQKVLDAQEAARAAAKTASIVVKSETGTQNANDLFKTEVDSNKGYYDIHSLPHPKLPIGVRKSAIGKTNSSQMSKLSSVAEQPDTTSADTVPRADFEKLANDCLATTIQLNNAQEWAAEQAKIYGN